MEVRRAGVQDLQGLMRLEEDCFGVEKFSENTLMAFLVRTDAFALVAEDEGVVTGAALCLCSVSRAEGRIASMATLPGHRRRGIGTRLLQEAEDAFRQMGARTFGLEVEADNGAAIALYAGHGYTLRAVVRDYYGAGRHAYAMEKVVPPEGEKVTVRPS